MAEMYCCECIFEEKDTKEMPCRECRNGKGSDFSYFVSRDAVDLIIDQIIKKSFE